MGSHSGYVGRLTIVNGQTASNVLEIKPGQMSVALTFVSPAAFTGTVAVHGSMGSETPQALAVDANAITIAGAQTKRVNISGIRKVQVVSGSTEGAERVVHVYAEFDL